MYKIVQITGLTTYQLVQDFFHKQYDASFLALFPSFLQQLPFASSYTCKLQVYLTVQWFCFVLLAVLVSFKLPYY